MKLLSSIAGKQTPEVNILMYMYMYHHHHRTVEQSLTPGTTFNPLRASWFPILASFFTRYRGDAGAGESSRWPDLRYWNDDAL